MDSARFDKLLDVLISIFKDAKYKKRKKVDVSTTAFTNDGQPFSIYVGTEGNITYTTEGGDIATEKFVAGYHIGTFIKIDTVANGTSATDIAALFN